VREAHDARAGDREVVRFHARQVTMAAMKRILKVTAFVGSFSP
jgi:hypothetical protein